MTRRLIGLDINGWHDRAMRDWTVDENGELRVEDDGALIDGGPLSCSVLVGPEARREPFGGPGARLAPHGRGGGWGDRGLPSLRRPLRRGFDEENWTLAIRALGDAPGIAVLAIPDLPEMTDVQRERRLRALRAARAPRALLAWSSVLIALFELEAAPRPSRTRLCVVEIDAEGLRVQTLTIRDVEGVLAPERHEAGRRHACELGFAARERSARETIAASSDSRPFRTALDNADLPGLLAMSAPPSRRRELLRLGNGDWQELEWSAMSPTESDLGVPDLPDCDELIVHSPAEPAFNEAVAALLRPHSPAPVRCAPPYAVARGGLIAADRMARDQPLWYDFLPAVDTIVERDGHPASLPLVPGDSVARAGRAWRSPEPVELVWPAGNKRIEIWLRKEDDPRPRQAPATVETPPDIARRVQLSLEQQPAQGRARLTISSTEWSELESRPARLDWDAGTPDPRSWDEIIESLEGAPPGYPERVVLPAHEALWYPEDGGGLAEALQRFDGRSYTPVYKALAQRMRVYWKIPGHPERRRKFYAVDSDGGRPAGVADDDWRRLVEVVAQAEEDLRRGHVSDNHALGVLSWSFRLCPASIWPLVAQTLYDGDSPTAFRGWHVMYPQALGRIAGDAPAFDAAIRYLSGVRTRWKKDQQACAAFLLTRNDEVFLRLNRATIEQWADGACVLIRDARANQFSGAFRYLPVLLAGLIRWRIAEPYAFVRDQDPYGAKLGAALDAVCDDPEATGGEDDPLTAAYRDVKALLDSESVRRDLLQDLFDLT